MSFKIRELYDSALDTKQKTACVIAQTNAIENVIWSDRLKSFRAHGDLPDNFPIYAWMWSVEKLDDYFSNRWWTYAMYISILFDALSSYIDQIDSLSDEQKRELLIRLEKWTGFSVGNVSRIVEWLSTWALSAHTEKELLVWSKNRTWIKKDMKMTQNLIFLSIHGLADEILPEIEKWEQAQDEYFEKKQVSDISKQFPYADFKKEHPEVTHVGFN